jgi:hypothetical protein
MKRTRSRIFINSYLVIALTFAWTLMTSVLPAYAMDYDSELSSYQTQLAADQETLADYTDTYTTYDPSNVSDLNPAATAVSTFSSAVSDFSSSVAQHATLSSALDSAQLAVDLYPQMLQTAIDSLADQQVAFDEASTNADAANSDEYRAALQDLNDKQSAYDADPSESNAEALSSASAVLLPLQSQYDLAQQDMQTANTSLGNSQAYYDSISAESYEPSLLAALDQAQTDHADASNDLSEKYSVVVQLAQESQAALDAVVLPPSSLVVSSLADTTAQGTLRWAITQANAVAGGISDKITFEVEGTITLTSNLPTITQNLTIVGPGQTNLTIDGQYLYSGLYVASRVLTVSDLTFSEMYNSNWQTGSALFAVRGTIYASGITVDSSTTAIATKEGGTTIYLSDSTLSNNVFGLFSNHGGTPTTPSADDSIYDNKIISTRVLFQGNNTAIYGERTMLVDDSTFKDNGTGFLMRGLNKHRVTNSTFEGNETAINIGSWWPNWPSYFSAPHLNAVITGNTFIDNSLAIRMGAYHNNILTQVGANVSDNIWDEAGTFIISYERVGSFIDTVTPREGAEYYSSNNTNLPEVIVPTSEPEPTSSPEPTQPSQSVQQPEATSSPEATPTPSSEPTQEPVAEPSPAQTRDPEPAPTVAPTPTPTPTPSKTPSPEPTASATPTPTKTAVPAPTSTATPTTQPTATATPAPSPTQSQTPAATPKPSATPSVEPTKQPTPIEEPVVVEIKEPITAENIEAVVNEIAKIEEPRNITTEQREVLTEATNQVFAEARQDSPEYEAALEVLTVLAQADDPELPEELAAIPLIGAAAGAVLEVLNDIGNAGADMSPTVREESEKIVVASVVVATAATAAATAATSAAGGAAGARTIRKIK